MSIEINIVLDVARKKIIKLIYNEKYANECKSSGMLIRLNIGREKSITTRQTSDVNPI
jgi:hypothetical protein